MLGSLERDEHEGARLSLIATSSCCYDFGVEVGIGAVVGAGIWGNGLPGGM